MNICRSINDLQLSGILMKVSGDEGSRSSYSGFKFTIGMTMRLRVDISLNQGSLDSCKESSKRMYYDSIQHPLLLETNTVYTAILKIQSSWAQIYVNDIPGPVTYNCFGNIANTAPLIAGKDDCCGESRYSFYGEIISMTFYDETDSTPTLRTEDTDTDTSNKGTVLPFIIGFIVGIIGVIFICYFKFWHEYDNYEIERLKRRSQSFIPPWKDVNDPVYDQVQQWKRKKALIQQQKRQVSIIATLQSQALKDSSVPPPPMGVHAPSVGLTSVAEISVKDGKQENE